MLFLRSEIKLNLNTHSYEKTLLIDDAFADRGIYRFGSNIC